MGDLTGGGWIHDLSPNLRDIIRNAMELKTYKNKDVIFQQGFESKALYEIVEGQVLISHMSVDGEETIVTIFGPSDCLGEQGLIDGLPQSNTATSYGACTLRKLNQSKFLTLKKDYPEITDQLLLFISKRFRLSLQLLEEASSFPLRPRLLRRLYLLATTHGKKRGNDIEIAFKISQTDLGKWVGYSRQSVNAELQSLETEGLVASTTSGLLITNLKAIETELEADEFMSFNNREIID